MKNLYIGNIPEDCDDEELFSVLSSNADIQRVGIFKDRYSDQSLGFGFVTVDPDKEIEVKAKLDGFDLKGRKITIN